MVRRTVGILTAALLAFSGACGSGGSGSSPTTAAFQFRTSEDVTVGIVVRNGGQPVPAAMITIARPLTDVQAEAGDSGSTPWFVGGTAATGRCDTTITLPAAVEQVDVVVRHAGSRGSYTDEGLRARWGPMAPAARITVSVSALGSLTIDLEDA